MAQRFYKIMGRAYTDMLKLSTGKTLQQLSTQLGYGETYLKNVALENRIRVAVATQIELLYNVPISPYIVFEHSHELEDDKEAACFLLDELIASVAETIRNFWESHRPEE